MWYFGEKVESQFHRTYELDYRCAHCRFTGRFSVSATGVGVGQSPFHLDPEGARMRADDAAVENLRHDARTVRDLVRCPRCHRRYPGVVLGLALWIGAVTAVLGALLVGVLHALGGRDQYLFALAGLAIPVLWWACVGPTLGRWRRARKIERSFKFSERSP